MKIISVAIMDDQGDTVTLPAPNRHHHVIRYMANNGYKTPVTGEQGFILDNGDFINRIEAMFIAKQSGQLLAPSPHEKLYSEDLW